MEEQLILNGDATIDDILRLHELGYEFVIGNGTIEEIIRN